MGLIYQVCAGILAGIVSGMGIGGGVILIPVLTLLLGFEQKTAQGINLLYFLPTGAAAVWIHFRNKNVNLKLAWIIAAYGIIGSVSGALLAMVIPSYILRRIFAVFIIFTGVYELYLATKKRK